jgi:hypothetical protein
MPSVSSRNNYYDFWQSLNPPHSPFKKGGRFGISPLYKRGRIWISPTLPKEEDLNSLPLLKFIVTHIFVPPLEKGTGFVFPPFSNRGGFGFPPFSKGGQGGFEEAFS